MRETTINMIKLKHDIFYITTTRYNNKTYIENQTFRRKYNYQGCVYNVPREMPNYIPFKAKVFVLEMNNDENIIMGIGYLYNKPYTKKYLKIHKDMNYNRYSYVSKYRIDRDSMTERQIEKLRIIEELVFKGKTHLKRGQGITSMTQIKVDTNKKFILNFMIELFTY